MTKPRTGLAVRIALLSTAVALITALVAGGLAVRLVHQANQKAARQTLAGLADAAQSAADRTTQARVYGILQTLHVTSAVINGGGGVSSTNALARGALSRDEIDEVLGGSSVSSVRLVNRVVVLVEARGTRTGGIVLVQRRSDAVAVGDTAVRRLLWALVIAVAIAILLGLTFAWRLARPLRRTAAAAHALAQGRRDIAVAPVGPTEVAEVADALNTLAAALAGSEARQREFLMSVSHDLRTPLTAISGYAESLADGVVPPDGTRRVGAVMLGEAHRLERLVADLLDLARLGAQDFRIDVTLVDIGALASSAAEVWSSRCTAEGVAFRLERDGDPLVAYTDPLRLRQILDGLFDNSLRVTPSGAQIVLAVRREGALIVAEVRDGGPGLAEEDLAVAFERSALYQRYRGVRQVGTGLGLAIVHGLATRLGASVEAGHAAEGGARFTVRMAAAG